MEKTFKDNEQGENVKEKIEPSGATQEGLSVAGSTSEIHGENDLQRIAGSSPLENIRKQARYVLLCSCIVLGVIAVLCVSLISCFFYKGVNTVGEILACCFLFVISLVSSTGIIVLVRSFEKNSRVLKIIKDNTYDEIGLS